MLKRARDSSDDGENDTDSDDADEDRTPRCKKPNVFRSPRDATVGKQHSAVNTVASRRQGSARKSSSDSGAGGSPNTTLTAANSSIGRRPANMEYLSSTPAVAAAGTSSTSDGSTGPSLVLPTPEEIVSTPTKIVNEKARVVSKEDIEQDRKLQRKRLDKLLAVFGDDIKSSDCEATKAQSADVKQSEGMTNKKSVTSDNASSASGTLDKHKQTDTHDLHAKSNDGGNVVKEKTSVVTFSLGDKPARSAVDSDVIDPLSTGVSSVEAGVSGQAGSSVSSCSTSFVSSGSAPKPDIATVTFGKPGLSSTPVAQGILKKSDFSSGTQASSAVNSTVVTANPTGKNSTPIKNTLGLSTVSNQVSSPAAVKSIEAPKPASAFSFGQTVTSVKPLPEAVASSTAPFVAFGTAAADVVEPKVPTVPSRESVSSLPLNFEATKSATTDATIPSKPMFTFGQSATSTDTKVATSSTTFTFGGSNTESTKATTAVPTAAVAAATTTVSAVAAVTPSFQFGSTALPSANSTFSFGSSTNPSAANPAAKTLLPTASFQFGTTNKPETTAPVAATTTVAAPTFQFGTTSATTTTTSVTTPAFQFGLTGKPSAVATTQASAGGSSIFQFGAVTTTASSDPKNNIPGTTAAAGSASLFQFGAAAKQTTTVNTGSVSGSNFSFGVAPAPTAQPTATTAVTQPVTAPFSFGGGQPATTVTKPSSTTPFQFGAADTNKATSFSFGTSGAASSTTKQVEKPATFSFSSGGAPANTTAGGASVFGGDKTVASGSSVFGNMAPAQPLAFGSLGQSQQLATTAPPSYDSSAAKGHANNTFGAKPAQAGAFGTTSNPAAVPTFGGTTTFSGSAVSGGGGATFTFGKTEPTKASTAVPAAGPTASPFTFGAANPTTANTTGGTNPGVFSFGASQHSQKPQSGGAFVFGAAGSGTAGSANATVSNAGPAQSGGSGVFTFGGAASANTAQQQPPSQSTFSFGGSGATAPAPTGGQAQSSIFQFGGGAAVAPAAAGTGTGNPFGGPSTTNSPFGSSGNIGGGASAPNATPFGTAQPVAAAPTFAAPAPAFGAAAPPAASPASVGGNMFSIGAGQRAPRKYVTARRSRK